MCHIEKRSSGKRLGPPDVYSLRSSLRFLRHLVSDSRGAFIVTKHDARATRAYTKDCER